MNNITITKSRRHTLSAWNKGERGIRDGWVGGHDWFNNEICDRLEISKTSDIYLSIVMMFSFFISLTKERLKAFLRPIYISLNESL